MKRHIRQLIEEARSRPPVKVAKLPRVKNRLCGLCGKPQAARTGQRCDDCRNAEKLLDQAAYYERHHQGKRKLPNL